MFGYLQNTIKKCSEYTRDETFSLTYHFNLKFFSAGSSISIAKIIFLPSLLPIFSLTT
jgi:hypothetical protein